MYSMGGNSSASRVSALAETQEMSFSGYREPYRHDATPSTPPRTPPISHMHLTPPSTGYARRVRWNGRRPTHSRSLSGLPHYGSTIPYSASSTQRNMERWPNNGRQGIQSLRQNFSVPPMPQPPFLQLEAVNIGRHNSFDANSQFSGQHYGQIASQGPVDLIKPEYPLAEDTYTVKAEPLSMDIDFGGEAFLNPQEQRWINSGPRTQSFDTVSSDASVPATIMDASSYDSIERDCYPSNTSLEEQYSNTPNAGLGISFSESPFKAVSQPQDCTTVKPSDIHIQRDTSSFLPAVSFDAPDGDLDSSFQSLYTKSYTSYTPSTTRQASVDIKRESRSPSKSPAAAGRDSARRRSRTASTISTSSSSPSSSPNKSQRERSRNRSPSPSPTPKRRSRCASLRTAPDMPRVNENGDISYGFINLTSKDRVAILAAVAPSGSSKTKARRARRAEELKMKIAEDV